MAVQASRGRSVPSKRHFPWPLSVLFPLSEPGPVCVECLILCGSHLTCVCLLYSWTKLTERFFKNTPWPGEEAIALQVGHGRYGYKPSAFPSLPGSVEHLFGGGMGPHLVVCSATPSSVPGVSPGSAWDHASSGFALASCRSGRASLLEPSPSSSGHLQFLWVRFRPLVTADRMWTYSPGSARGIVLCQGVCLAPYRPWYRYPVLKKY